ncbi:uncharacterized protein LOC110180209 [Drosophila serrata]|uniref:uncharacterized protein LOC110180209 n=1 Tax=Drosophila serrata TaxID=7274 RepID=UPI000A1D12AB|nr:uncharacterized protein LOC110180209 [Drosophila serrata]
MRLTILWMVSASFLSGIQIRGQNLLLAELHSAQDELNIWRLASATSYLTKTYIANRMNTLVIRQSCLSCPSGLMLRQRRVIDEVLWSLAPYITVLLHRGTPEETSEDYTLFVVNDHLAFKEQDFTFPDEMLEREFYFVVVVTELQTSESIMETAGKIIVRNLQRPVINVVVVAQLEDGQVNTYAYKLFKKNCTAGITMWRSNYFDLTTGQPMEAMPDLYPVRFVDLSDCPLNVSANVMPPHLIYKGHGNLPPSSREQVPAHDLAGIDWELLQLLARALRFRINVYMPTETSQIFGEGNVTGCFAQLANGSAQLAIGGLSGSDKRRWQFSKSTVYHQSHFVLVVRRDRYLGRFGPLLLPFRGKVWTCIVAVLLLAVISTCCLRSRLALSHPLENLVSVSMGNPMPIQRLPGSGFLRYLLASWLLLTLVLRCAYQARFFDVLRLPHHRPLPEDLAGVIGANYTLVSNGYHDFYPLNQTQHLGESFGARFKRVQHADPGERLTTISLISNLGYWNHKHRNISQLTFIRQPIYLYQLVIYFPRRSFLKPAVDRKIKQLQSAGVIAQIDRRYLRYGNLVDADNDRTVLIRITWKIMSGAYRIHLVVLILAGVVFVLEWLSGRWTAGRLHQWMEWVQTRT